MNVNKYFVPTNQAINHDVITTKNFNFLLKHKQDYFKNSFFIRSANLRNSLPADLKAYVSISIFRSGLYVDIAKQNGRKLLKSTIYQ